jgi:phosphoribosyl-ATP pyrophosphohydrolase/phosphoribosyl-AMP cyclohydrolase/histidinol dehydrogenase
MIQDAVDLALMEGLHGHSRAASLRLANQAAVKPAKRVVKV